MKDVILTIDTGGSKTKLIFWDNNHNKIGESTCCGYGVAEDTDTVHPGLLAELKKACADFNVIAQVCNLGGKNKMQITKTLSTAFPGIPLEVYRESEGNAGITLCQKYDAGVALFAGTGTIAIAPLEDKTVICGGWGANIGDKGSGYDLGLRAIQTSLEMLDGFSPMSALAKEITGISQMPALLSAGEYCDLRDNVRKRIGPLQRASIANYAKTVASFAKSGDSHALELFSQTATHLARLVLCASQKTGTAPKRVVVTGGLVNCLEFWKEDFERKLNETQKTEEIIYLKDGIDEALYVSAMNLNLAVT